ncbi:MAG: hypothetical protein K0B52_06125 [FCB group bacterium]|nr:hypothetical protein [FCB group bacterium]
MKTFYKLWDLLLLSALGVLGSGCILDPPPAEYGPQPLYGTPVPEYGVSAVYQEAEPGNVPDHNGFIVQESESEAEK